MTTDIRISLTETELETLRTAQARYAATPPDTSYGFRPSVRHHAIVAEVAKILRPAIDAKLPHGSAADAHGTRMARWRQIESQQSHALFEARELCLKGRLLLTKDLIDLTEKAGTSCIDFEDERPVRSAVGRA